MNLDKISGHLNRRQILKLAGYGALGLMAGEFWPFVTHSAAKQNLAASKKTEFVPDLDISLVARPSETPIFPGEMTQVWQYRASERLQLPHLSFGLGR